MITNISCNMFHAEQIMYNIQCTTKNIILRYVFCIQCLFTTAINTLNFKKARGIESAKRNMQGAIKIVMPKNGIFTQFILYLNIIS